MTARLKKFAFAAALAAAVLPLTGCYVNGQTIHPPTGYHYIITDRSAPTTWGESPSWESGRREPVLGFKVRSVQWSPLQGFTTRSAVPLADGGLTLYSTGPGTNIEVTQYFCGWNSNVIPYLTLPQQVGSGCTLVGNYTGS